MPEAFEVASIKVSKVDNARQWGQFYDGGRFSATNTPLAWLIRVAYDLPLTSSQPVGGPDWLNSERYNIEAKASAGAIPLGLPLAAREGKMKPMLQALLADRFKLLLRHETRERAI